MALVDSDHVIRPLQARDVDDREISIDLGMHRGRARTLLAERDRVAQLLLGRLEVELQIVGEDRLIRELLRRGILSGRTRISRTNGRRQSQKTDDDRKE